MKTPKPITVFTAGAFDGGLHAGHRYLLSKARKLGDKLIVAVNHDAYLARKGPGRPLMSVSQRAKTIFATGLVSDIYVIEDNPLDLIKELKPDVIVAGGDYDEKTCIGAKECGGWGGKIVIIPRIPGISTTNIIKQQNYDL